MAVVVLTHTTANLTVPSNTAAPFTTIYTNMKFLTVLFLALVLVVSMALARPGDIIDVDYDHFEHEQDGIPGTAVHGEYSAIGADGNEYEVKYVADHLGYRLV